MNSAPLAYTVEQIVAVSGIARTGVYGAIKSGELRAVKRGRRTLVMADDLRGWLQSFPTAEPLAKA